MPRSIGYNSIVGWKIIFFPANYYEQNLQKNPEQTNKHKIYYNYISTMIEVGETNLVNSVKKYFPLHSVQELV